MQFSRKTHPSSMATRSYNSDMRRQRQSELRARIAAAAAELHAIKGALATSYADIAERAGVSLPTVYSHFPSQHDLMGACTGHVAAQAPPLAVDEILAAPDLRTAAGRLVAGIDKLNAYFDPWMAWNERRLIPFLAEASDARRRQQTALIAQLLSRHLGPGDHRELAAAWESLVHFDLWHRLVREHKLSRASVRALLVHLLLAAVGPRPAARLTPRPKRKQSA
jgi:AcrR family transcriptional regulator